MFSSQDVIYWFDGNKLASVDKIIDVFPESMDYTRIAPASDDHCFVLGCKYQHDLPGSSVPRYRLSNHISDTVYLVDLIDGSAIEIFSTEKYSKIIYCDYAKRRIWWLDDSAIYFTNFETNEKTRVNDLEIGTSRKSYTTAVANDFIFVFDGNKHLMTIINTKSMQNIRID
jgi:hypothetical protein